MAAKKKKKPVKAKKKEKSKKKATKRAAKKSQAKKSAKKKALKKVAKKAASARVKKASKPVKTTTKAKPTKKTGTKTVASSKRVSLAITEYKVVQMPQIRDLEDEVNYLIGKGWQPQGGLVEEGGNFFQAMVRGS